MPSPGTQWGVRNGPNEVITKTSGDVRGSEYQPEPRGSLNTKVRKHVCKESCTTFSLLMTAANITNETPARFILQ